MSCYPERPALYWQELCRRARIKARIKHHDVEGSVTILEDLRKRFEPQIRWVFHFYWRLARSMTLGVRAVVLDADNRVFLVKHS